jgi:hypothetical protein
MHKKFVTKVSGTTTPHRTFFPFVGGLAPQEQETKGMDPQQFIWSHILEECAQGVRYSTL